MFNEYLHSDLTLIIIKIRNNKKDEKSSGKTRSEQNKKEERV